MSFHDHDMNSRVYLILGAPTPKETITQQSAGWMRAGEAGDGWVRAISTSVGPYLAITIRKICDWVHVWVL